jgi:hypothetical protein
MVNAIPILFSRGLHMTDIELPGPPLSGFAVRLLEDRPANNQKKGYWLKMAVLPANESQARMLPIEFTPRPHRVFGSEAEAKDVRDQLTGQGINTEVINI